MRSSRICTGAALAGAVAMLVAGSAPAQTPVEGFALERLAPVVGSTWLALDALDMPAGFAGAASATFGYSSRPLVVRGSSASVVSDQALVDYGFMVSWNRLRLSLVLSQPLHASGHDLTVGSVVWTAPMLSVASHPDSLADARVDATFRLWGDESGPVRLGLGAQLYVPSGNRADYLTDGTVRATGRLQGAGRLGPFDWAGSVGIHVRPLDVGDVAGAPKGSEAVWAVALGVRREVGRVELAVGPEFWGFTVLRDGDSGVEGLLMGRVDVPVSAAMRARFKLAVGAGLLSAPGVPEWRSVLSLELVGRVQKSGE